MGLSLIILILSGLFTSTNSPANVPETIVGTWVTEGSSFENRWVYHENNTLTNYFKNQVYKTFSWTSRDVSTPSGLTLQELILTNTENPNDEKHFQIDTLTDEHLILVYNTGVGLSRNTYFKH